MNDRIKQLGDAINETLSNSEQIADAISRIKSDGYDVFLVLEATVGFNKRDALNSSEPAPEMSMEEEDDPELVVNAQDLRFLKSLRITMDEAA